MYLQNANSMCKLQWGKKSFNTMNGMFIVTSNTLDSNQNIMFMISRNFFFTLWTYTIGAHTKLVSKCKFFQSWSALHKTRNWVSFEKKMSHANYTKQCILQKKVVGFLWILYEKKIGRLCIELLIYGLFFWKFSKPFNLLEIADVSWSVAFWPQYLKCMQYLIIVYRYYLET